MEIDVKGHSGCQIDIVREDSDLFIFKSSYDKKYLSRLCKQAEKQKNAFREEYQHVRIPQIFSVNQDDEHVTIKMEYVYSRNFVEYFESAGFEQINYFIKAMILYIEKELKVSPIQRISTRVTFEKYLDVEKKVLSNSWLNNDDKINKIMQCSRDIFLDFAKRDFIDIPVGSCHGDLTFSNILFNGNNYYLIDFLDSFIESPLLDIVKIRQDSAHLWSQLMYVRPYDRLRLKIICEKIDREIDKYFSKYNWYKQYYYLYQLLNLLRILQYAKEEKVIKYLKDEISKLLTTKPEVNIEKVEATNCSQDFTLIIPAAADDILNSDRMPYVFSLDNTGIMLCIRAVQGLELSKFDKIYFTILRKHAEEYCLEELFKLQFKRLGLDNARLVILDASTDSQSETVYKTIIKESISGSIFIKDADGFFETEIVKENGVAVFPLEEMKMVDPQHKSYVSIDDMYYITNIIEKKVISHFFNVGGVCFEKATDFLCYYLRLQKETDHLCMSHIIYSMLLDKYKFRPMITKKYVDWGSEQLVKFHQYG